MQGRGLRPGGRAETRELRSVVLFIRLAAGQQLELETAPGARTGAVCSTRILELVSALPVGPGDLLVSYLAAGDLQEHGWSSPDA